MSIRQDETWPRPDLLLRAAGEARALGWVGYAEYCELYAKGLRKQGLALLREFVRDWKRKPFAERWALTRWLIAQDGPLPAGYKSPLLPYPLAAELARPTLAEARSVFADEADVWYWSAVMEGNAEWAQRALDLDPMHIEARCYLIEVRLYRAWFATHHMPDYFIGEPLATLEELAEARTLFHASLSKEKMQNYVEEMHTYRSWIEQYGYSQTN